MRVLLYDLMQEVNTHAPISKEAMEKAKTLHVTSGNNRELRELVADWINGDYDEDPELLAQQLESFV